MAAEELPVAVPLEEAEPLLSFEPAAESTEAVAAAVALIPEAPVVAVTDASGGCEPEPPDDDIARTPKYAATATTATSAVMAPTMIGLR